MAEAPDQSASDKLQDASILHGISIQRVSKTMRNDVLDMVIELRDKLIAKLHSSDTITDWQKQRITSLLQYANGTIDAAYQKVGNKFAKDLMGISDAAIKQLTNSVNQVVGVNISAAMAPQQLEAIANTKNTLIQGATQKDWWSKQSNDLQDKFSALMKNGMLIGQSVGQMTPAVADLMESTKAQAEALVRTAVATVQSQAQQAYYENNDDIIKGVQWVSTLDNRTTPVCRALDGLSWTYDADQGKMKPVGHEQKWLGYPPVHFNCRSTTIPVLRKWAELSNKEISEADDATVEQVFQSKLQDQGFAEDEAAQIQADQRASMNGQVASAMSYEEWLKSKPESFQQQVLGQARWKLWQDGQLTLQQMIDGNGQPLTIPELHQAIADNVAVPIAAAKEGEDGLTLGERGILQAQRTDGAVNGKYHSTWLDADSGVTVEQSLIHSLTEEEYNKLTGYSEEAAGREVEQPKLIHLSNSLKANEYWDESEMKLWASVPGFSEAKIVTGDGRVASIKLKAGKNWTVEDVQTYHNALPGCEHKYPSTTQACAFKATGKVTWSMTKLDAVKLDPKSLKMVYPAIKEKPAPYFEKGPTPAEVKAQLSKEALAKAEKIAQAQAEHSQMVRQLTADHALQIAQERVAAHETEAAEAQATIDKYAAEVAAAKKLKEEEKAKKAAAKLKKAQEKAEKIQKAKEAADAAAQAAEDAAQAAKYVDGFPANVDDVTVVKTLGGSTGAQLVKDDEGTLYVRKEGANAGHVAAEVVADQLYRVMGIDVPEPKLYSTDKGPVKLAKYIEGETLQKYLATASQSEKIRVFANLQHGFVADALLGNWDVVGLDRDNILVDKTGKVWRIDNGGSLEYRAMGAKKTAAQFGPTVTELTTFLDGSNPRTAEVFAGITQEQIADQIKFIARNKQAILDAAPDALKSILSDRIDYLIDYAKVDITTSGNATWASDEAITKQVAESKINGVALWSDKEGVEDGQALAWTEKDINGKPRTMVEFKLTVPAMDILEAKLKPYLGKAADNLTIAAKSLPSDTFFDQLQNAAKTVNHHLATGDMKFNAMTVQTALGMRAQLEQIAVHGSEMEKEMATKYLAFLDKLAQSIALPGGTLVKLDILNQYEPPPPPKKKVDAQQVATNVKAVQLHFDEKNIVRGEATNAGGKAWGPKGTVAINIDLGDIQIQYIPRSPVNDPVWAFQGQINVRAEGEPTPELMQRIQGALKDQGIDMTPPTDEYKKALYLTKNIYIQNKNAIPTEVTEALKDATINDEQRLAKVEVAANKFGLKLDPNDKRWQGYTGKRGDGFRYFERMDLSPAQIEQAFPKGILTHQLSRGVVESVDMFLDSGGQITPTTERLRKGIPMSKVSGMSSSVDIAKGSGKYMFTRIKNVNQAESGQFIFGAKQLSRVDAWSFNGDVFGAIREQHVRDIRKTSLQDLIGMTQYYGNETIFKNGFDMLTDVKYIVVSNAKEQAEVLNVIKKHGITKWGDGRALDKVVVLKAGVK